MTYEAFPIARFHLTARADAPLRLPDYAGSMLRGAFGHALLGLTLLPHKGDTPCALKETCPYCQIFATPAPPAHSLQKFSQVPNPYVIEPPPLGARQIQAGETFSFNLVLIGRALDQIALVIFAFERALKRGLGKQQSTCTLLSVSQECAPNNPLIWQAGKHAVAAIQTSLPAIGRPSESAHLLLKTPLRLQHHGQPVGARELDARTLLITLARRHQLLADLHLGAQAPQLDFQALDAAARTITLKPEQLRWFSWTRYSNRQQQEMHLGGLTGSVHLQGDLRPFAQLLHEGQWLHVGKNTTFGLGHYQLEWQ